ncbi:hypothetical protein GTS_29930 [Gandjariella thermophila]|uniref:Uncharacterized protein n=1 Tax=Gandjariella thermophila TaxID=1931992 RepID=A0A4D4J8L6_9PSEU|nr:hypothetical protein GTS_29930 [Gandjariella thermophila]
MRGDQAGAQSGGVERCGGHRLASLRVPRSAGRSERERPGGTGEEPLQVFTQVPTPNGLKSRIRDRVLDEAVPL